MLLFHNITALLGLIEFSATYVEFFKIFKDIFEVTVMEQQTRTLIYARNVYVGSVGVRQDEVDVALPLHFLLKTNPIALISIDTSTPTKTYEKQFNLKLLSVVQLNQNWENDEQLLRTLLRNLHRNRQSKIILLFADSATQAYVAWIMKLCADKYAINAIALQPNMTVKEYSYWTLKIFPETRIIKQKLPQFYHGIFPKHLNNMHGYPFRIIGSAWHPQMYNFTSRKGKKRLSGYLGKTLRAYAHHRNATILTEANHKSDVLYYQEVRNILLKKGADTGPLWPLYLKDDSLSYTSALHRFDLCLMVPVETPIPRFTFYYRILGKSFIILFCISLVLMCCTVAFAVQRKGQQSCLLLYHRSNINFSVLQGFLGMPFWFRSRSSYLNKFISMIIVFAGLNFGTIYVAYLHSFIVNSPLEASVQTIDDLVNRNIMVAMDTKIFPLWMGEEKFFENYKKFTLFKNVTELLLLRDNLDTRYAFPVTSIWRIYNEQQKYFDRPLFRLSNICFQKGGSLVIPLEANSIYRESLSDFVGRIRSAGLTDFWLRYSFIELLVLKRISIENRNPQRTFEPIKMEDLQIILLIMTLLIILSFCCLVLEIFWVKIERNFICNKKVFQRATKNTERHSLNE